MNIIGLGEKIIEDFYNMGILNSFESIYHLGNKKEELTELEGFGPKSISKLLDNIEESKNNSLEKLVFAIGIKGIGESNAKILAKRYGKLDNLMQATREELNAIDDIGPILAESVASYFEDEDNKTMIENLKKVGVNMNYKGTTQKKHESITNKKFVITGTLEKYSRDELKEIIENYGGKAQESVSKKTDALILGENPGSKYDKAKELGIPIWTEETLKEMKEVFTKY